MKLKRDKLIKRATKTELEFKTILKKQGIKFYFQKRFENEKFNCIVDFYIPKKRIVIELDGGYHYTPEQINRDRYRDYWLKTTKKCKVIRIDNDAIGTFNFDKIK